MEPIKRIVCFGRIILANNDLCVEECGQLHRQNDQHYCKLFGTDLEQKDKATYRCSDCHKIEAYLNTKKDA